MKEQSGTEEDQIKSYCKSQSKTRKEYLSTQGAYLTNHVHWKNITGGMLHFTEINSKEVSDRISGGRTINPLYSIIGAQHKCPW